MLPPALPAKLRLSVGLWPSESRATPETLLSLLVAVASSTCLLKKILLGRGLISSGEDAPSEAPRELADIAVDISAADMTEAPERAPMAETVETGSVVILVALRTSADSASDERKQAPWVNSGKAAAETPGIALERELSALMRVLVSVAATPAAASAESARVAKRALLMAQTLLL